MRQNGEVKRLAANAASKIETSTETRREISGICPANYWLGSQAQYLAAKPRLSSAARTLPDPHPMSTTVFVSAGARWITDAAFSSAATLSHSATSLATGTVRSVRCHVSARHKPSVKTPESRYVDRVPAARLRSGMPRPRRADCRLSSAHEPHHVRSSGHRWAPACIRPHTFSSPLTMKPLAVLDSQRRVSRAACPESTISPTRPAAQGAPQRLSLLHGAPSEYCSRHHLTCQDQTSDTHWHAAVGDARSRGNSLPQSLGKALGRP